MVVSFNRGARGQNALRQLLAPVVKEIMEDKSLIINTSPVDVYKSWVNQLEMQTGEARGPLPINIANSCIYLYVFNSVCYIVLYKDSSTKVKPDCTSPLLMLRDIVGNLLYYRYMNPAIVAPDGFDIIDMTAGGQIHPDQRRNLGCVAKVLQHAASNKLFEGESEHLSSMNTYLSQTYQKFRYGKLSQIAVQFVYKYKDSLLLEHQDAIATEPNDLLNELLEGLGPVPDVESFLELNASGYLTVKLNWKVTVLDFFFTEESEHSKLVEKRAILDSKTPEKMKRSQSIFEDGQLPIEQKKRKIQRNLRTLEQAGLVSSATKYQEIINEIAKDIRNQRRYRHHRKAELVKLQQTLNALNSKTAFYEEQINYYNTYIKTCLDNLTRKSIKLDGKEEVKGSKKLKQASLKYTAARLHEKGVILEIEDLQTNQ
uniref:Ras-GAP domain-containing protein n=1 Tax=Pavo cristatus TaxID=9049 RepID=A0A8C9G2M6_PAVCR